MSREIVKSPLAYRVLLMSVLLFAVIGSVLALIVNSASLVSLRAVLEARSVLVDLAAGEQSERELTYAAIEGMVNSLDDQYAAFVPPELGAEFRKQLTGNYVGIGAYIRSEDGWLTIVSPIEGSPAFRAGLMPDDRVLSIDSESTEGKTADECVLILTGEAGDPVDLEIQRESDGEIETFVVTLVREAISTRSVTGLIRDPEDPERWIHDLEIDGRSIGYARIGQFQETSSGELNAVLEALDAREDGIDGFVLDLRGNPGGPLNSAIEISEMFMDEGLIVAVRGRGVGEDRWEASPAIGGTTVTVPMVVLVDGQSASASEIVAGALASSGRARIVGSRTFGKGTVQGVLGMRTMPGAQLKFTEAYYYVGDGAGGERNLNRSPAADDWGVDPSEGMYLPLTDAQRLEMIQARNRVFALGGEQIDPGEGVLSTLADPQLDAAVEAISARLATGAWVGVGEPVPDGASLAADEAAALRETRAFLTAQLDQIDEQLAGRDAEEPADLLPDDAALAGGRLEVFDADGERVGTLRMTRDDLERWLRLARVEAETPEDDG